LKPDGKAAHATIMAFLTYFGSILSLVTNTFILQCFDIVGWATGSEFFLYKLLP